MKTKDNIKNQNFGGLALPKLHGHTKIILTDVKTGEQEVVEKDNLVTNAISLIFSHNIWGAKNYKDITPIRDMLGGILCFENELDEYASQVRVPGEADNRLIAHAGQSSHSSASTTRGNPNGVLSEEIQNGKGYKFVWDFSTSQGNGTISALSLTHKWLGDIGTKPVVAITDESLLLDNTNKTRNFNSSGDYPDFAEAYFCLLSADFENNCGVHAYLPNTSGNTTLVITEVDANFKDKGINEALGECKVTATHTITLTREFRARYSAVTTDWQGKIYVVTAGSSSGHSLYVNVIDPTDWSVSAITITDASITFDYRNDTNPTQQISANAIHYCIVDHDGYLYWLNSTKRSFYKINLTNIADISLLTTNMTEDINVVRCGMVEANTGLIYGSNFIINDDVIYPSQFSANNIKSCTSTRGWQYRTYALRFMTSTEGFYEWAYENDSDYNAQYYLCSGFPICYTATVQNLETPVTKTSDKTMQIQYSVTIDES